MYLSIFIRGRMTYLEYCVANIVHFWRKVRMCNTFFTFFCTFVENKNR